MGLLRVKIGLTFNIGLLALALAACVSAGTLPPFVVQPGSTSILRHDAEITVGREVECRLDGRLLEVRIPTHGESTDKAHTADGMKVELQVQHQGATTAFECASATSFIEVPVGYRRA